MKEEEFQEYLLKNANQMNLTFSQKQIQSFYWYMQLLIQWNQKMNLTAIKEPKEIIVKHFLDSLSIQKYIKPKAKVIDIGTGAGFPGIPLKIMNSSNPITLLDSLQKRITFLQEVVGQLGLTNIETVHARAEEYIQQEKREKYDVVVSRAVANLSTLLEYMLPYAQIKGICTCMKGPNIEEELKNGQKALQVLGGKILQIDEFTLPDGSKRKNIIIQKIKNTPVKYPRGQNKPLRNPIIG